MSRCGWGGGFWNGGSGIGAKDFHRSVAAASRGAKSKTDGSSVSREPSSPQEMMVVLGEAMGFVADIFEEPERE